MLIIAYYRVIFQFQHKLEARAFGVAIASFPARLSVLPRAELIAPAPLKVCLIP